MTGNEKTLLRAGTAVLLAGALTACGGGDRSEKAPIEYRGSEAGTVQPTAPDEAAVLATGVRDYGDYQAAVATSGETVGELATRVGLSASELGAYNGLSPTHVLAAGDELVLPPRPGGYSSAAGAPDPSLPGTEPLPSGSTIEATPIDGSAAAAGIATADADAWSPDLAEAAIARATGIDAEGNLAAPLSANDPLPENPSTPGELSSPNLQQYQSEKPLPPEPVQSSEPLPATAVAATAAGTATAAAVAEPEPAVDARSATALERPVAGPIAVGYRKGGTTGRNDGVDFAAAPGTPVVAADDGEVALVSQSLGGLGTIVLVRHAGDLLTVYGRVDGVDLKKGALVSRGQQIGTVAQPPSGSEGRMHFEVRRGAESLDPTRFIDG